MSLLRIEMLLWKHVWAPFELYLVLASSSSHESRMLGTLEGRRGDDKHLSKSSKNHSFDVTLMIRASETNARRGERSGEKSGER